MFWAKSNITFILNEVAGQVEVQAGQVNFRGSLLRSENDVLQPMLHPDGYQASH